MRAPEDIIVAGGRIVDPGGPYSGPGDIILREGRIAEVIPRPEGTQHHPAHRDTPRHHPAHRDVPQPRGTPRELPPRVRSQQNQEVPHSNLRYVDARGLLVTPGLIDLHLHAYWGATPLGVRPADLDPACGSTTIVDAGSAGAGNFAGFLESVITGAPRRILAFLNISFGGIFGFGRHVRVGEAGDPRLLDVDACAQVARQYPEVIRGIKVRLGRHGSDGALEPAVTAAVTAADACGLPLMAHMDAPPPTTSQIASRLRPGDIATHIYRPLPPGCPESANHAADAADALARARERGVYLDVAHGEGSFSFNVARKMLARGLAPDTISSDLHRFNLGGPVHSLTHTLSKFLALGLSLEDLVRAASCTPARILQRGDLGGLTPGKKADLAFFTLDRGRFQWTDSVGETLESDTRLKGQGRIQSTTTRGMVLGMRTSTS